MIFKHPVYHLKFSSKYYMNSTFLRIGEDYPVGMSDTPTFEEALDFRWHHVYLTRWNGLAIKVKDVVDDLDKYRDSLTSKESRLDALVQTLDKKGLLICSALDCKDSALVPHELVHAVFAQHRDYAKDVKAEVEKLKNLADLNDSLVVANYLGLENDVDEINAYALTGRYKKMEKAPAHRKAWKEAESVLHPLFQDHFGFSVQTKGGRDSLYANVIHLGALI